MATSPDESQSRGNAIDRALNSRIRLNWEAIVILIIIAVAVFTRFYDLETRVMSHDESLHTYYSWRFLEFQDYEHTPMMHGPLQFHLIALSYFLFGDSDASSRFPVALAGVISIILVFAFRKWFGRWGSLIAAALMVVSPYMLYYQRYVRNEALVVLLALIMFYAVFSYYETKKTHWLYLLAVALTLHYATKETSYIYFAQLFLFLVILLAIDMLRMEWKLPELKWVFATGLAALILGAAVAAFALLAPTAMTQETTAPLQPLDPDATTLISERGAFSFVFILGSIGAGVGLLIMVVTILVSFGKRLRTEFPALDLLIVSTTLSIPLFSALFAWVLGFDPVPSQTSVFSTQTGIIVVLLFIISLVFGLLWDWKRWLICAAIFFGLFAILYTSLFTNGHGISSGLVSSLEYWREQHGVERGSQPWYYYILIQIPFYEYLAALGFLLAIAIGVIVFWKWLIGNFGGDPRQEKEGKRRRGPDENARTFPVIPFLAYWSIMSVFLYSFAGERMPWLTVHIALPLILLAGWAYGWIVERLNWQSLKSWRGWAALLLILVLIFALWKTIGALLGPNPPFQGSDLVALGNTSTFLTSLAVGIGALILLIFVVRDLEYDMLPKAAVAMLGIFLFILTVRTAFRASYQKYDEATEYLVYAHSATGVKDVLAQVEEFSRRTTGGLAVNVAYDDDVSWPMTWYLRNYTNTRYFGSSPTREVIDAPLVIAGDNNWGKVDPLLGRRFLNFEYIRMWWPMQDYFGLTWDRIKEAITSPEMRGALWDIWLNRDYTAYGEITGKDFSLENWNPSDRMKFYLRKDLASTLWDFGTVAAAAPGSTFIDPYDEKMSEQMASTIVGEPGASSGQFMAPRGIAFALDGSMYVADSRNHRIQHLSATGEFLGEWGQFADINQGDAPLGTFNEPWGVGVGLDGSVYVADTWNHRIQKFTADGEPISSFGRFGQGEGADVLWGPREVVVDDDGRLFVADTGNKRITVYNENGELLTQFGGLEYGEGLLNEPVGLDIGADGRIYIADTWNQRIAVYTEPEPGIFQYSHDWLVDAWYGESLENKPYLSISSEGIVCVTDPEGYRVLCFNPDGVFQTGWGDFGSGPYQFGLPSGLGFMEDRHLWVTDAGNNRLMLFEIELP
ncbi:MAG: TIGR03663 family protein [Anaerolineales bacterium]|nr:TIGR03663 family protein [Anaerolineales bacterium]